MIAPRVADARGLRSSAAAVAVVPGVVEPAPPCNTGAETSRQLTWWDGGQEEATIGVGWLRFTVWAKSPGSALGDLQRFLGEARPLARPSQYYSHSWRVLHSSTVSAREDEPGQFNVEVTQTDCEGLGWPGLRGMLLWVVAQERWNVSRFDLNYDDRECVVSPEEVHESGKRGDVVTHVPLSGMWQVGKGDGGYTAYFGQGKSDEQLRVYKGQFKHGGDPFNRWELQLRRKSAHARVVHFFRLSESVPKLGVEEVSASFWGCVARLVDFREQDAVRPEDRTRLPWWERLVGSVAKLRLPKETVVPPSFARTAAWLRTYVSPSMAFVVREVRKSGHGGHEFLWRLVEEGEATLKRREKRVAFGMAG